MFSGYGTVTHFALGRRDEVPKNGKYFTGIGDYLAMRLCGVSEPAADATMAASFGGYDLCREAFDLERLEKAGVLISFYPAVLKRGVKAGRSEDAVCVNVGTGSQVSLFDRRRLPCRCGEVRPFPGEWSLF